MKTRTPLLVCLLVTALPNLVSCGGEHKDDHDTDASGTREADADHEGPHGGHLVKLGSAGHLEFLHDPKTGMATLYLTGPNATAPLTPDAPPTLKLVTPDGQRVLNLTEAAPGTFTATDAVLRVDHLEGRIAVTIAGVPFNPDLEETHHH
jgi:hypothetical protein